MWQHVIWLRPTSYTIARKRSKCKWTLRLSRCFHLALLLNSISQSCVLLLSQINCWCSDPRNWILTFLSVSCESSKGRRRHGRSKRIWVKCFGRSLCWFLSSCNFSETEGSKIQQNLMLLCLNIRCLDIKALNFQQRENYLRRREEEEASGGNWPALQKEEKWRKSNAKWQKQIITFGEMFFAKV